MSLDEFARSHTPAVAWPRETSPAGYRIGRRIGMGGMAVVDAAHRAGPGPTRLVALKRLAARFSGDDRARRLFLREASILTRIEHPNVVRTYEVGEVDGEAFIAMELLEGATLAQLMSATRGRVPVPIALRIARDALRGLHQAHELQAADGAALGLVHQDVSPQNIHVAYEGTTRILDFGVARLAATDASRTGSILGKSCYLSPEQLALGVVDRRADVFALGVVLYELLTGVELFPRESADAAYAAILKGGVHSPRSVCPDLPEPVDSVVRRALAREPHERLASADAMRVALAEAQEHEGIRDVDVAVVGAWVVEMLPRAWTRAELERELTTTTLDGVSGDRLPVGSGDPRARWFGGPTRAESADIHVLPTLGKPRRRRATLWVSAAAGAALVAGLGALAGRAVLAPERASPSAEHLAFGRIVPAPAPALLSLVSEAVAPSRVTSATSAPLPAPPAGSPSASPVAPPRARRASGARREQPVVAAPSAAPSAPSDSTDDVYEHM
jgi:serine/threonine protein kinase